MSDKAECNLIQFSRLPLVSSDNTASNASCVPALPPPEGNGDSIHRALRDVFWGKFIICISLLGEVAVPVAKTCVLRHVKGFESFG